MFAKSILSMYSKRVLLVDDNSFFLEMGKAFFRREQVEVLTARGGREAREIVQKEKPDLVFMDLYMPGEDGDEACRQIKSDYQLKSIPIVMMTSSDRSYDIDRCRAAGCDDFIQKPITREKFLKILEKFLKLPRWSGHRKKIRMPAKYGLFADSMVAGLAADLSVGGIFLETENPLSRDSVLHLEFQLGPDFGAIKCRGRVVWANLKKSPGKPELSPGMGIEFTDMRKVDLLLLTSFFQKDDTVSLDQLAQ